MEALAAVSRCLRRFYFFKTETLFLHGNPGGGEQVPPAVLFFQNRDPFFKTRGHGPWAAASVHIALISAPRFVHQILLIGHTHTAWYDNEMSSRAQCIFSCNQ